MNLENPNNKSVSIRLPLRVSEILEQEVIRRNTNASEVIRRAIVLMNRMRDGIFVPISNEEKVLLKSISEKKELPIEEMVSNWVTVAIKNEIAEKPVLKLRLRTTQSQTFEFKSENKAHSIEENQLAYHAW